VLAPADAVKRLRGKIDGLEQVAPGDVVEVGGTRVHVTEADHGRVPAGLPGTIDAVGYVVEDGDGRVYFAGDTDLFSGMEAIGPVDVALLPIWGWGPRLGAGHLDPRRAAEAAALLRAGTVVPIHWGTLLPVGTSRLRPRYLTEPAEAFARFAAEVAPAAQVRRLAVGEHLPL
jgi:L-ascorbate metabolism protein UlaG (beta-lactamase superfamily)